MRVLFLGREHNPTLRLLRSLGDDVVATRDPVDLDAVRAFGAEAIVSHDYGHIVPSDVLESVGLAVNLHVSLLPWNRGTHPNLWSFVDDTPKGVTVHHMDSGVDTGDVVAQCEIDFGPDETLASTHRRLQEEIATLFADVWPQLRDGSALRAPQTWAGTYHRDADLEAVRPFLTDGWETPAAAVTGLRRRLREEASDQPTLLIRCDGSPAIGSGHVTRCRALAAAVEARGFAVRFAMRVEAGSGAAQVECDGFPVEALPGSADQPTLDDGDVEALLAAADRSNAACVLVDHYGADSRYFERIRAAGLQLAIVDDRADRNLGAASWLLNQNLAAPSLPYRLAAGCTALLGVDFALLRPQFAAARARIDRRFGRTDARVLITLGGGDTETETAAALRALDAVERRLEVRAVIGGDGHTTGVVEAAANESRHDVAIVRMVEDMAGEMARADVSVNAGGSTCWELACLGVPMVVSSLSADQRLNPDPLVAAGVAVAVERGDWPRAAAAVAELLEAPARRASMSEHARALVDGLGARRAAASLESLLEPRPERIAGARG